MSADTAAREITLRRVFDAPREEVWRAWTEPERLTRWWGKRGWTAPLDTITMDVRPGGVFRLTNVRDDDGREMPQQGVYREVVEPERLVVVEGSQTGCPEAEQTVTVVTFADLGGGRTEVVVHATVHTSGEILEQMTGGMASALERLAGELARKE